MPAPRISGNDSNGTVSKRQKLETSSAKRTAPVVHQPKIFAPFRTVGLVSPTNVPFTALPLGKTTFQITTSVGRSLQTYDLRKGLNIVFITRPQTPETITATLAWKKSVFAAWGGQGKKAQRGVWVFQRGKKVDELETPRKMTESITQILALGEWIVGCGSTGVEVWKASTLEHYTTLRGASPTPLSGGVCTMPTYLNKIFMGKRDGSVEIWNLNTAKLLYTLLPPSSTFGAVTALQPSPALSLLAIAYESGPLIIHDVRADKEILRLNTGGSTKLPITSISFRTDGLGAGADGREDGVMATASIHSGDITFWDLNHRGRKMGVLHSAHNPAPTASGGVGGGVSKIEFLPGQSVLVSSGLDNSLKSWIFDETPFSPIPRLLHCRGGHAAPISTLHFLPPGSDGTDDAGKWLLSGSRDRSLWGWSLRRDGQSTEFSQGALQKKAKKMGLLNGGGSDLKFHTTLEDLRAPPITCLACSLNRDGGIGAIPGKTGIWTNSAKLPGDKKAPEANMTGWESIVTGHEGDKVARTWFWGRKRAGRWAFETGDGTDVKSVAMSPCGTFALIGSAGGSIDMYNLQSGKHRQRFPARLTPSQAKNLKLQQLEGKSQSDSNHGFGRGEGKHKGAVTGITVDSLNRTVISCGEDGKVKFWDFATTLLLHEIDWYPMTKILGLRYHRPSDLVALSCDDGSIRVVDIETRKLIRELWGGISHAELQTVDYTFSNDGRWIISASSDSIIRIWDLPTGHLIDAMKLPAPCTSIAFSNTGEYLATAQEGEVGVHIWTNRTLFAHVSTRHISEQEVSVISAPTASGEGGVGLIEAAAEVESEEDPEDGTSVPMMDQLTEGITTLSLVPKSRWQTLVHLDIIRARNKPKEAPKKPEKAPFFLPSVSENPASAPTVGALALPSEEQSSRIASSALTSKSSVATSTNEFTRHLAQAAETAEYTPLLSHLSSLPPSAADVAIRTMDTMAPYTELRTFISALTSRLKERRDYELVQAWMSVFLKLHGDVIVRDEEIIVDLRIWQEEAKKERERVGGLVGYSVGVVGWVRSAR
ncbi:Utp21 specific WD40 associated putative domain-domain-containing protein [Clohesyomyces aquaticus]|uniref:Utp21 specific WD40 associated putative domain-domain-containing protein n=1 Tax=Clohesyomyces aquaticus TaxID=1231657 RepID=A0A1Y2A5J4_9PLEO|nr:Utp21 specific WD40 associated putative domain-domain-containing protein [Clohesyomyces aquaticus]